MGLGRVAVAVERDALGLAGRRSGILLRERRRGDHGRLRAGPQSVRRGVGRRGVQGRAGAHGGDRGRTVFGHRGLRTHAGGAGAS